MGHRRSFLVALVVATVANLALLAHFHDRFWWPPDDGLYADAAARLAAGQVLNRDIEEGHPGYIHFLNEAAFRLFGLDFVSLRYPVAAAALLEGVLMVLLLAGAGWPEALLGGLAAVILGLLQFLNPHPHWYCALIAVALAALLTWAPRNARWRVPALGFLVGLGVLFRQLSGVFLLFATAAALLSEPGEARTASEGLGGRLVLGGLAVALAAYLAASTDLTGLLLFGLWPVLLLGSTAVTPSSTGRIANRQLVGLAGSLALGGMASALPLVAYHLAHGSLGWWLRDVGPRAVAVTGLPYLKENSYGDLLIGGLLDLADLTDLTDLNGGTARLLANGLYWLVLPLVAAMAGVLTLRRLRAGRPVAPLCVVAVFYGLVALFNQIPIYLYYSTALSLAALLLLAAGEKRPMRAAALAIAVLLLSVGLRFHAGQSVLRGLEGMVAGTTTELVPSGLERCTLKIDPRDRAVYREVVDRITAVTPAGQPVFVFPNHAELYFLTGRPNPFRFHSTALGIHRADEIPPLLARLASLRPRMIVHAPNDPNTTAYSQELLRRLGGTYRRTRTVGPFDLYEPRERGWASTKATRVSSSSPSQATIRSSRP